MISVIAESTLFRNGYMSHIVFLNSTQTLRFEWWFTLSKSYAYHTWLQPYIYHNIIKYEVTLPFVIENIFYLFSFSTRKEVV
jgi:hypothetical protein